MKSSTKRVLSIGLSFLFFIGILLVYVNLISPELTKVQKKRALVLSKEALFANQKSAVEGVQKIINQFQSISRLQETVSLALPLKENTTQALNQLEAISRNSRANIASFDIEPLALSSSKEPIVKRLGSLELNLNIRGSYEALKDFLRFLETNVRLTNVQYLHFVAGASNKDQDSYDLNLKAEMFYQEE